MIFISFVELEFLEKNTKLHHADGQHFKLTFLHLKIPWK